MNQYTLRHPVSYSGFGIYYKRVTHIRLLPALPDTGILFKKKDYIRADLKNVYISNHTVGIKKGDKTILSIEHLLAAIYGMGIDNLIIEVKGDEIPFGDGSAKVFLDILQTAGIERQKREKSPLLLRYPVYIRDSRSILYALPYPFLSISLLFSYNSQKGLFSSTINDKVFTKIARARTFGYYPDPKWLSDVLGIALREEKGILFAKEERFKNEPLYHKVLDLIGMLTLLGRPLKAALFAYKPGHKLSIKFLKDIIATEAQRGRK